MEHKNDAEAYCGGGAVLSSFLVVSIGESEAW